MRGISFGAIASSGGTPYTPPARPSVAGLLAEYRFDEGSGTTLLDHSGNGNDATLGFSGSFLPTWDSKGLKFNNALVQLPNALASSVQAYLIVADFVPQPSGVIGTLVGYQTGTAPSLWLSNLGHPYFMQSLGVPVLAPSVRLQGPNAAAFDLAAGKCYWNGTQTAGYLGAGTIAGSSQPYYWLGYAAATGYLSNDQHIYHLLLYDRTVAGSDVAALQTYQTTIVQHRGVTLGDTLGNLPQIVCRGDSLTYGAFANFGKSWPELLGPLLSGSYRITNLGISGQTAASAIATQATCEAPLAALYAATPKVYMVWFVTNDVHAGDSSSTILSHLQTLVSDAIAAGYTKVVVFTPHRFDATSVGLVQATVDAELAAVASGISGLTGVDAIADLWADPNIGSGADFTSATNYYSDHVHLVDAGQAIVAGIAKSALNAAGVT